MRNVDRMDRDPGPRSAACRRGPAGACSFLLAAVACTRLVGGPPAGDAVPPPASFQPADISIGEPTPLPFPAKPAKPAEPHAPAAGAPMPSTTGRGWLGLAVAESTVPGRWAVEEVVANGPAARAGIVPGDEVRAINGVLLGTADEVSQVLTAISPGQQVRIAVARQERVSDLVVTAEARPTPAVARGWQSSEPPAAARVASGELPLSPPRSSTAPPPSSPAPPAAPPAAPGPAAWAAQVPDASPSASGFAPLRAVPPGLAQSPTGASAANQAGNPVPPRASAPAIPEGLPSPSPRAAPAAAGGPAPGGHGRPALGVRTVPVDGATQARLRLSGPGGAYVTSVVQGLPASKAGVPPGSVITALDDRAVGSPADLAALVAAAPVDRPVTIQFVVSDGSPRRAQVVLEPLAAPLERALVGAVAGGEAPEPAGLRRVRRPTVGGEPLQRLREEARLLRRRLEDLERRLQDAASDPR